LIEKIPNKSNRNLLDIFKDIIAPPLCAVCGKIAPEFLCNECLSEIKEIEGDICSYCGRPLAANKLDGDGLNGKRCNLCKKENFNFFMHRSFTVYRGGIKKIIKKYKYNRIYALKDIMSRFLKHTYVRNYKFEKIDYIETVPGKHMEVLCESFSGLIKIPFAGNIIRIRNVLKQQGLNYIQRKNNVKQAFKVRDCLLYYGKNILLVDDVWTTGNTLMEISDVLKKAGADKIYLLTLARGAQ
jgi:competence protein ComFC